MIDATIVRAHPQSTGLEKRGFERSDRPLARRIDDQDHAIVDGLGNPLVVSLTGGHVHDERRPNS
jgi:hypothetical protein